MTPEMWQTIAIIAVAVIVVGAVAWAVIYMLRRRTGTTDSSRSLRDEIARLRTDLDSLRDRNKLLEERTDRFDRAQTDLRNSTSTMHEDVEARLTRLSSHEQVQKELQEQIYEVRKEHQVLMERDERHERRLNEVMDQISALRQDLASASHDGKRVRN